MVRNFTSKLDLPAKALRSPMRSCSPTEVLLPSSSHVFYHYAKLPFHKRAVSRSRSSDASASITPWPVSLKTNSEFAWRALRVKFAPPLNIHLRSAMTALWWNAIVNKVSPCHDLSCSWAQSVYLHISHISYGFCCDVLSIQCGGHLRKANFFYIFLKNILTQKPQKT